jgi:hypothetical protein
MPSLRITDVEIKMQTAQRSAEDVDNHIDLFSTKHHTCCTGYNLQNLDPFSQISTRPIYRNPIAWVDFISSHGNPIVTSRTFAHFPFTDPPRRIIALASLSLLFRHHTLCVVEFARTGSAEASVAGDRWLKSQSRFAFYWRRCPRATAEGCCSLGRNGTACILFEVFARPYFVTLGWRCRAGLRSGLCCRGSSTDVHWFGGSRTIAICCSAVRSRHCVDVSSRCRR